MSLVNDNVLDEIKRDLKENYPELYLDAFLNIEARELIKDILKKKHSFVSKKTKNALEYVVQETVGLGVIDDILTKHPLVTDISYNATDCYRKTSKKSLYIMEKLKKII